MDLGLPKNYSIYSTMVHFLGVYINYSNYGPYSTMDLDLYSTMVHNLFILLWSRILIVKLMVNVYGSGYSIPCNGMIIFLHGINSV